MLRGITVGGGGYGMEKVHVLAFYIFKMVMDEWVSG
jgi:hypothetical protein